MAVSEKRIPTNLRTLMILEVIGRGDQPMTPTEINAQLGLPKQTVHRLCTTLEEEGFLSRDVSGKRLRPSRRLRLLGHGLIHASRFHIARHQILTDVAHEVGETVNYVVPEETGMHYLDRVETDWPFRIQLPVGSNVPFNSTASGKTFMASMSKKARTSFVNGLRLEKLTANTLDTTDALLAELNLSASRGYSLDNEEFMEGMIAISVPVTDPTGRFVAALAFHGPTQRISIEGIIEKRHVLFNGAQKLQAALFSREPD